jgi:flavin-dependent dehydrogenase
VTHDVAIIGAGPAGLACAIAAAQRGLRCAVFERREPPLDKPCGEGLLPSGVRALAALGVRLASAESQRFVGICYVDDELEARGTFESGFGLGVRRTALSEALIRRARELCVDLHFGVELRRAQWLGGSGVHALPDARGDEGARIETSLGTYRARTLVAADGLHSRLRREAGLALPRAPRRRFGVRRHYRIAPWSDCVEVHWAAGVEAYVTPAAPGQVGVALLWNGDGRSFDELLARFPSLAERLAAAPAASATAGAGLFEQRARRRVQGRLVLSGDAAGYLDPLTGEGLSLAFRSAHALAPLLAQGHELEAHEAQWRALSRSYFRMTRLLLEIGARPRLRRRVVSMLAREPALFSRLLAISSGDAALSSLTRNDLARLLRGLVRSPVRALEPSSPVAVDSRKIATPARGR